MFLHNFNLIKIHILFAGPQQPLEQDLEDKMFLNKFKKKLELAAISNISFETKHTKNIDFLLKKKRSGR